MAVLLLLLLAPDSTERVVRNELLNFEVRAPDSWDLAKADANGLRVYFKTVFAGVAPASHASVQVFVTDVPKRTKLEQLARKWRLNLDGKLPNERISQRGKLGDADALLFGARSDNIQVTWSIAIRGRFAYVFYARRVNRAIGDEDLEEEIAAIRKSFRFLRAPEPEKEKPEKKEEKPDPRRAIRLDYWRLDCVKPAGLVAIDPRKFDPGELANGCILKMTADREQSRCMIRVYARKAGRRRTLEHLRDLRIAQFTQVYKKPPKAVIDKKWKPDLARKTLRMRLAGKRRVKEVTWWRFAECRNGVQYQVEIYLSGPGETVWQAEVADFLAHFKPTKR